MVTAVVGANWGDEGKGKITDMLGEESDVVARFQGGANAGHTILNGYGKFALHMLPSGVFYGHIANVIGNGVALNIPVLLDEIRGLEKRGVPTPRILVSDRAQVVMSYHVLFDQYEEERLGGKSFGSTKSGIAPFYSDKYAKIGFQVSELFGDEAALREKVARVLEGKNALLEHLYGKPTLREDDVLEELMRYRDAVAPYACDVPSFLRKAMGEGKRILLEGQLGALKDTDHGIYPMVTSSSTLAAYGAIGCGIPPYEIGRVIAVCKAYSSAVGAGEFVTEIFGEEAEELRKRGGDGGEYGATTGRPRRMGWFDAVASRYGCLIQGATEVALTVLDVLGYLDEIPVCVGYEIDGKVTRDFPTTERLAKARPVYERLPGWKQEIRGIRSFEELPENCRNYVAFIEKELGVPVTMISNGPGRGEVIRREARERSGALARGVVLGGIIEKEAGREGVSQERAIREGIARGGADREGTAKAWLDSSAASPRGAARRSAIQGKGAISMDFFNRVGEEIVNVGEGVAKAAKEATETASLHVQISTEESKIKEQYRIIGQRFYEENEGEPERMEVLSDAYREAFEQISISKWKIENAKEAIAKSKGAVLCPQCGASVSKSAVFCSKCGTRLKDEGEQQ